MSTGEVNSHRLRRTDKSVLNDRGVEIDTNDDTARIYPCCFSERRPRGSRTTCKRRCCSRKPCQVPDSIDVGPCDVVLGVTPSSKGKRSARKVDRGVLSLEQQVSLTFCEACTSTIDPCKITDDCTRRVNSAGPAAGCAGWIEECVVAVRGPYKALVSGSIARVAAGRVGTGKIRISHPRG